MNYQTILVHVDESRHASARMRYAAALAHAHGAHLVGAAMLGVPRDVFPHGYDVEPGTLSASYFEPLAEHARRALARFEAIARELQVAYETRFIADQSDEALAMQARFADLVVISQDDPDESMPDLATRLPESLILNCARPVLVVPRADPPPYHHPKVLLAWDGSREASAAIVAALPLLRHCAAVTLAALTGLDRDDDVIQAERGELLRFLARHRITPHFLSRPAGHDSGRTLLALADELGCGMLAMGCYGHSRFRELCLGGASRTVLAESAIPLLLAH